HARRLHMARIAAQFMQEQGVRDFHTAKRKAAERLGVDVRSSALPSNQEVENALAEHQRLFEGSIHQERLAGMRAAALEAMIWLAEFKPRLVGDVLSGLANAHSDICLHVFADPPELFDLFLQEQGIPHDIVERRLRVTRDCHQYYPAFRFAAGDHGFEAILFSAEEIRQPPLSLVDGSPMQRAGCSQVERLITES